MSRPLFVLLLASVLIGGCAASRRSDSTDASTPWAAFREGAADWARAGDVGEDARPAGTNRGNADGGRYLAEIALHQLRRSAFTDPDYPAFRSQFPEAAHTGLVNPDNLYESASIRSGVDYVIRGTRGTTADVVFQVYEANPGVKGSLRGISTLSLDQIHFEDDGSFEVHVGPTPHPRNWLKTDEGAGLLLARWSHSDWATERAGRAEVVRVGSEGVPAPVESEREVARAIRDATAAVPDAGEFWLGWAGRVRLGTFDNDVTAPRETGGEGLKGQVNVAGKFALDDGEALIVTVPKTDARYQGFQLGNFWFDSLEWANRQTSLSGGQARLGSDGRYHYVISEKDPGVPNWLDTTGLREGLFFLRFQGLRTPIADADAPTARLVRIDEIRKHLPPDTPVVDAAARRAQLAARQTHLRRRYGR